jgi:hypothetical protein
MLNLPATDHPLLKDVIGKFQSWDRKAVADSKGAAVFILAYHYISNKLKGVGTTTVDETRIDRNIPVCA